MLKFVTICVIVWIDTLQLSSAASDVAGLQQNDVDCCMSDIRQLKNQTDLLESKLNDEIAKREQLESEVQSKNDQTEFLQHDVVRMNNTLFVERSSRLQLEAKLHSLEQTLNGLQSTLGEERDARAKIANDIKLLDGRLSLKIIKMNVTLYVLDEWVGRLRNETIQRDNLLSTLNHSSVAYHTKVDDVSSTLNNLDTRLSHDISKQQVSVSSMQTIVDGLNILIQQLDDKVKIVSNLTAHGNNAGTTKQTVMFSASQVTATSLSQGLFKPHFQKTITNIGVAFDTITSLFTCPTEGNYLFIATIQKEDDDNSSIQCWIRRNGAPLLLVKAMASFPGTPASSTNSVVLHLQPGDRVELSQCSGDASFLPEASSFSGILL